MKTNLIVFVLIGLIVLLILKNCTDARNYGIKSDENKGLITAINDSIRTIRHNDSTTTARIQVLKTESVNDFIKLQTKDHQIEELQSVVSQYRKKLVSGSSVTVGTIKTVDTLRSRTSSIVRVDTVKGRDSLVYLYPSYKDSVDNGFTKVVATMSKDSSIFAIGMSNDFSAVLGYENKKPFIDFNLKNPNSTVTKLRTYQVSTPPAKKWSVGPMFGYGVNQLLQPSFILGVSVQYSLIRF